MRNTRWNFILLTLLSCVAACAPQPTKEVPQEFKKGQKYFHRVCSNCHGSDAMGMETKAPRLIDTDFVEKVFSDDDFRETILNGTDKMPPQKNNISADEITEIIKYLRYSQQTANLVSEENMDEEDTGEEEESEKEGT
ncbi:MAG: cytochrome c [Nitrospinota bacterium]|nr:cytochrome c [Nitrospinota bacterium]